MSEEGRIAAREIIQKFNSKFIKLLFTRISRISWIIYDSFMGIIRCAAGIPTLMGAAGFILLLEGKTAKKRKIALVFR